MPAAWNTDSNVTVKLASRAGRTLPVSLLHYPRLDRMLGGSEEPDATGAVLDDGKDVDLRAESHAPRQVNRALVQMSGTPSSSTVPESSR